MSRLTFLEVTVFVLLVVEGLLLALGEYSDQRINRLNGRVDCLEHPHAESSIAGRFVGTGSHRRFVVTQPAHRTGCTP